MARDGSGTYSLPQAAFVSGTTIESAKVNSDFSDVASALTQSISKDGQTTYTASQPMGGFKLTGLGAATGNGESVRYEQITTIWPSLISGWTYSNNVADATNDIDITAGRGADSLGTNWISGGAMTKRLDATFTAGTGGGGLDTGSIANTDYYIWALGGSAVTSDYVFSTASAFGSVTLPTGFTYGRRIGWIKRVGGVIVLFHTYELEGGGLDFAWDAPTLDLDLSNTLTTSRRTDAVKVPLAFSTIAHLNVVLFDAASGFFAWVTCPDTTDAAPSNSAGQLNNFTLQSVTTNIAADIWVRTSATGTVAARASLATVDNYRVSTQGFMWSRR